MLGKETGCSAASMDAYDASEIHPMKRAFVTALLLALPLGVLAQGIEAFLPKSGVIRGTVMVPGAPPELSALSEKWQAAMTANAEWARAYVEKAGPGELPYHKNFGMTEEEYKRMLTLLKTGTTLQRGASIEIVVRRSTDGVLSFATTPSDSPLNRVTISASGNVAQTPYGPLRRGSDINQRNASSPTGRWSGPRWEHEEVSDKEAWKAQFAMGRRDDFGDGVIYYNVIRQGSAPERIQLFVLYPLQ